MKVGIVGAGLVGSTAAYAMVMRGVASHLVIVDKLAARAQAEADDIRHAVPFSHPAEVHAGRYEDLIGSKVVVLAAGVGQKPGESRLQLLHRNADVFLDAVPKILSHAKGAVLVVATNPVDVMTHLAARIAVEHGMESSRVLGSGTTLDSARFRSLLGTHLGVDPHHVHGYVVGEHGDSEVLTWSQVTVAGMPLESFAELRRIDLSEELRQSVDGKVRGAAGAIIAGKGATYYGVGSALARITEAILHNQRSVLTVCTPTASMLGVEDVTVSLPRLVGGNGVLDTFPLPLSDSEQDLLQRSALVIRAAIDELP